MQLGAVTHLLKHKKYVQEQLHIFFHSLKMVGWFKNPTAWYECHQPRHNVYRNRQIIRACFAPLSKRLDHRP